MMMVPILGGLGWVGWARALPFGGGKEDQVMPPTSKVSGFRRRCLNNNRVCFPQNFRTLIKRENIGTTRHVCRNRIFPFLSPSIPLIKFHFGHARSFVERAVIGGRVPKIPLWGPPPPSLQEVEGGRRLESRAVANATTAAIPHKRKI